MLRISRDGITWQAVSDDELNRLIRDPKVEGWIELPSEGVVTNAEISYIRSILERYERSAIGHSRLRIQSDTYSLDDNVTHTHSFSFVEIRDPEDATNAAPQTREDDR